MISIEELKQRYPNIIDVKPHGWCIVVPGDKFDPDWEFQLEDQGYGPPKLVHRPWFLWGDFPSFMLSQSNLPQKTGAEMTGAEIGGRRYHKRHDQLNSVLAFNILRSFFRAKIPLPLSIPIAQACREALAKEIHLSGVSG
jgi:hypothetical protein